MSRAVSLLCAALLAVLPVAALAQDSDRTTAARASLEVGEQVAVRLEVVTGPAHTDEINPAGPSWNGVELVRVTASMSRPSGEKTLHTLDIIVASFAPGEVEFQPVVTIVDGSDATPRLLPPLTLKVLPSLRPGEPLEISPLAPAVAIGGAESPLLKPAVALGVIAGVVLLTTLVVLLVRRLARGTPVAALPPAAPAPPSLLAAERDIVTDPVAAYRTLASVV
ncbi:MAG: hypothetical protein HY873_01050, partial [Chloroflexi bacterium]|nr:hypothetical protein [Chloroflexota bacterium]